MAPSSLQQLAQAIREILPGRWFTQTPVGQATHRKPQRPAWVALLMAWSEGQTPDDRWQQGCEVAMTIHPHWRLGTSYCGFTDAVQAALKEASMAQARAHGPPGDAAESSGQAIGGRSSEGASWSPGQATAERAAAGLLARIGRSPRGSVPTPWDQDGERLSEEEAAGVAQDQVRDSSGSQEISRTSTAQHLT